MDNEDWIICETLHTVTDLSDFIELYSGESGLQPVKLSSVVISEVVFSCVSVC